jgi:hypothetical protein
MTNSFSDVSRLFRIKTAWLSFADCTEAAMTCADVATEHESRSPIGPTLKNVWTTGFLTDGVQVESFDQLQDLVLVGRIAQTDAKPFGFGLTYLLIVTDYTEFAGQLITSAVILRGFVSRRKLAKRIS